MKIKIHNISQVSELESRCDLDIQYTGSYRNTSPGALWYTWILLIIIIIIDKIYEKGIITHVQ